MDTKEKDVGEFLKDHLKTWELKAPDVVWTHLQENLEIKRYNRRQLLKKRLGYTAISATVLAILGFVVYCVLPSDFPTEQVMLSKENSELFLPQEVEKCIEETKPSSANPENIFTDAVFSKEVKERLQEGESSPLTPCSSDQLENMEKAIVWQEEPDIEYEEIIQEIPIESSQVSIKMESVPFSKDSPTEQVDIADQQSESENFLNATEKEEFIKQKERDILLIPNSFTPDGDGINDYFLVYAKEDIFDFEMFIYDRHGRLLFNTRDILQGWNGETAGQMLPSGIYVYMVTFKDVTGERKIERGTVYLSR